jgi:hypothetical protein
VDGPTREDEFEELVAAHIAYQEAKLAPVNGAPPAGDLLRAAWDADEAGVEDIALLTQYLESGGDDGTEDEPADVDVPPTVEPTSGSTTSASDISRTDTTLRTM